MVSEQLKETEGPEAGFLAKLQDPSAKASFHGSGTVIGTAGMIQESRAVVISHLKPSLPFVEGLSRDAKPFTSQGDVV